MDKKCIAAVIIAMEKAALEEWNKGNVSGYLAIYSSDITYFDPFQEKRIDGLEKMTMFYESLKGEVVIESYEMIDPVVNVAEGMAVLSYNLISYGGENTYKWNCTEVYKCGDDNQWKIVHNHWSLIKPLG